MKKSAKERLGGKDKKKKAKKTNRVEKKCHTFFCNVMQIPVFNLFCVSSLLRVRLAALQQFVCKCTSRHVCNVAFVCERSATPEV